MSDILQLLHGGRSDNGLSGHLQFGIQVPDLLFAASSL